MGVPPVSDKPVSARCQRQPMIEFKTLKMLIRLMVENDLTEMDLGGENDRVKLRRGPESGGGGPVQYVQALPGGGPTSVGVPPANPPHPHAGESGEPAASGGGATAATIDSPMVGTFFATPSPESPAFVSAGDRVDTETVVCIIEAMKVFNEIKAERSGTIKRVLVESGATVEFGQPLFELE